MPKFFEKCIFPGRLRKITGLISYFERSHPTKNSILHLLSRIGHLPSDCTALRAARYTQGETWSATKPKIRLQSSQRPARLWLDLWEL